METRKITIINSKTQAQKVIENSTATTLGELKAELRQADIDYADMTFFEGYSRTELQDDLSVLPSNIPYKGQVVNDLVFMLTSPNKKVKSGMDRAEAYAKIKELGLQNVCKSMYGKNFTQCSTVDLVKLVEETQNKCGATCENNKEADAPKATTNSNVEEAVKQLVDVLYDEGIINSDDFNKINATLNGVKYQAPKKMSKQEIDSMFNFIK